MKLDISEEELRELLDLFEKVKGIAIKAPEVTLTFGDIFDAGKAFDRLHRIFRRQWHD